MKKGIVLVIVFAMMLVFTSSAGAASVQAAPDGNSCWGQASAVFARTGVMGEHSSQQANPRYGLRNLARALYDAGVLPNDSLQALGAFVASELGLSIDACQ